MPVYDVPGVYIEEVTGPGVIAGVGTSTSAFIGPALAGPILEPRLISSFDEFLSQYGQLQPDGSFNPYILTPRTFYLAHGVRGFYENGGRRAYIVRIATARATAWDVKNQAPETVFRLRAKKEGTAGDNITIAVQAANFTGAAGLDAVKASATVAVINGLNIDVNNAANFRVGDVVTRDVAPENFANRATITQIQGNVITLSNPLASLAVADNLRIASVVPDQAKFRMASVAGLAAGTVAKISGTDADANVAAEEFVVVQAVDPVGFVTLATSPARAKKYSMAAAAAAVKLTSQEFRLIITPPVGPAETFDNLSLNPFHPNYVFARVNSTIVDVVAPAVPPVTATFPGALVAAAANLAKAVNGANDAPESLTGADFKKGLDTLRDIEDANIIVVPDAGAHPDCLTIQQDMINHCLAKKDRFAILDSRPGAPPTGPNSVELHRQSVQSDRGFAALYYPWLQVRDPSSTGPIPRNMLVPPSGAMAGVYARTDGERGVHKAPANTDVRGVTGLERILSDAQQGPLNLKGINALRIFPGTAQAVVWGARTTVDPNITDWIYVPVRRLLIFLEQSIEEGIRWAVFEPNGLPLWQKLKRTLNEFLTRVWRDGALFGATADKAYYVRIDEALNPPSTRALGRLYIEIGVAAVRPAEFIIVRIGLWDGGAEISES